MAGRQIGFARVVTDFATFAWLADVFIVEEHRGHGFSKKLVAGGARTPTIAGLATFHAWNGGCALALRAVWLYAAVKQVERFMEIHRPNPYKCG